MLNIAQIASNTSVPGRELSQLAAAGSQDADVLKSTFQQFVGETFFQMMLKSMRKTHGKPAYLHGGQAEEIFQSQLDQEMAGSLANTAGSAFSNDLYELFRLQLEQPTLETAMDPAGDLLNR